MGALLYAGHPEVVCSVSCPRSLHFVTNPDKRFQFPPIAHTHKASGCSTPPCPNRPNRYTVREALGWLLQVGGVGTTVGLGLILYATDS